VEILLLIRIFAEADIADLSGQAAGRIVDEHLPDASLR